MNPFRARRASTVFANEGLGICFVPKNVHFAGVFLVRFFFLCAQLEDDDVFLMEKELRLLIARVTKSEVVIVSLAFDVSHVGGAVASALRPLLLVLSMWRWVRLAHLLPAAAEDYTLVTQAAFLSDLEVGHDADFRQLRLFVVCGRSGLSSPFCQIVSLVRIAVAIAQEAEGVRSWEELLCQRRPIILHAGSAGLCLGGLWQRASQTTQYM